MSLLIFFEVFIFNFVVFVSEYCRLLIPSLILFRTKVSTSPTEMTTAGSFGLIGSSNFIGLALEMPGTGKAMKTKALKKLTNFFILSICLSFI